ncbi:transposase family protein [Acinetobacter sp. SM34]|uniref:transposase family protein n=1 Tax=Acinetobacter sp. SM34 TaxID=1301620 RepID=UPI001EDBF5DE|nr:transposase family protein [Acinetobacter sp. SM34]MCG2609393.1 transposase family protein [Acinetobacter sp. SM34]
MKYSKVKTLSSSQFKRLIGIQPSTFLEMLEVLKINQANTRRGRPSSLLLEDQLLMTLSYWREYRTLFHVAMSYGLHESSASRIIQKIENILIKSDKFHLPKKLPHDEGLDWDVVIVDATEMVIERPKKTEKVL